MFYGNFSNSNFLSKNPTKLLALPMKYIRCSYQLKVAHLIKFIQNKTSPVSYLVPTVQITKLIY